MIPSPQSSEPIPPIAALRRLTGRAANLLNLQQIGRGAILMWIRAMRHQLYNIYGRDAVELQQFPLILEDPNDGDLRQEVVSRLALLNITIASLEMLPLKIKLESSRNRVFIGHGRSPLWRELKDFLAGRLSLPWDEFNREVVAGYTTSERLEVMMAQAAFAILVLTAEEELINSTLHARANVIHEVGLFQGCLGLRRAIVLIEEGCSEFSNISGLSQIRFPHGDINARFEEIRKVLEREKVIGG